MLTVIARRPDTPPTQPAPSTHRHHGPGGYTLSPDGEVVPFDGAPWIDGYLRLADPEAARAIILRSDDRGGYVLDAWGGIHQFGSAPILRPIAHWPSGDLARDIVLCSDQAGGYVLDGRGGIHPFGSAAAIAGAMARHNDDIARCIVLHDDDAGGYVLDSDGGCHYFSANRAVAGRFGDMPPVPLVTIRPPSGLGWQPSPRGSRALAAVIGFIVLMTTVGGRHPQAPRAGV